MIFTINTFEPIIPNIKGKEVILYLIKAPKIAPTANKTNSIPFTTVNRFRIILYLFLYLEFKNLTMILRNKSHYQPVFLKK